MGFSTAFLKFLHTVVFLIGAAVTAISIYLIVQGNEYLPENYGPSTWYAWMPFAFGLLLMFLAVLGCCCTKEGNVCFLTIYGILQFCSGFFIIVAGSFVVVAVNRYMFNVVNTPHISSGLDSGIGGAQQDFSDFMLGLAQGCCGDTFSQLTKNIPSCSNASLLIQGSRTYCYLSQDIFENGRGAAVQSDDYCQLDEINAACNDDPSNNVNAFLKVNYDFLEDQVLPGGIALLVFGSLLFLAAFFSCHVGCKKDKKPKKSHYEQQGGNMAYGGNMTLA